MPGRDDSAWSRVTNVPGLEDLVPPSTKPLERDRRSQLIDELHALAERARLVLGSDPDGRVEALSVGREFQALPGSLSAVFGRLRAGLSSGARGQLLTDVVDLGLFRAELLVGRSTGPGRVWRA